MIPWALLLSLLCNLEQNNEVKYKKSSGIFHFSWFIEHFFSPKLSTELNIEAKKVKVMKKPKTVHIGPLNNIKNILSRGDPSSSVRKQLVQPTLSFKVSEER
jgi:hypothetical protein